MGVFDELPVDGNSRTAQQLSDALGVEKLLLGKSNNQLKPVTIESAGFTIASCKCREMDPKLTVCS